MVCFYRALLPRRRLKQLYRRYRWTRLTGINCLLGIFILIWVAGTVFVINLIWNEVQTQKDYGTLKAIDSQNSNNNKDRVLLRQLLYDEPNILQNNSYPDDLFSPTQLRSGAVLLHLVGLVYMFVALAIVCDEFFVPALEVIIERLGISEDVAGATFMAAGGSAPELFTSLIGIFVAQSDVGIGTIVGSAVFNILFVIGMCSFFSKTVLALTWWPLFRDCCFYSISLAFLIAFFRDSKIRFYEACILFLCYISYVLFMKFNERIEDFVKTKICKSKRQPSHSMGGGLHHQRKSIYNIMVTHDTDEKGSQMSKEKVAPSNTPTAQTIIPSNKSNLECSKASKASTQAKSDVGATKSKTQKAPTQEKINVGTQKSISAVSHNNMEKTLSLKFVDSTQNANQIESKESLAVPTPKAKGSKSNDVTSHDQNLKTKNLSITSLQDSPKSPGRKMTVSICMELEQKESKVESELEEEESEPLDMSFPEGTKDRIIYLICFPLTFLLWVTVPDVRRPDREKFFIFSFFLSIAWIGAYSWLMVWMAATIGEVIYIPQEVMGLTVLAAGTSVPDLITSVIVAKKGHGDMAVSSSVGSNIFDITVGLPIPWILKAFVDNFKAFEINSQGLFCSISMLLTMLIAVVCSIAASKWNMSKGLGVAMMVLYLFFLVAAVSLEMGYTGCPLQ